MIRRLTVVLAAAAFAAPVFATDVLSSSYWDAAYLNSKVDADPPDTDTTLEGFRLAASIGLAKFLNFTGDYEQRRALGTRLGTGSAGFAYHTQDPVYRFHFGVTYERIETDVKGNPAADEVEEGYGAELGGRAVFGDFELQAAYRYMDFGEFNSTGVDLTGARYGAGIGMQLSPWWSLVADYRVRELKFEAGGAEDKDEFNEWTVGFRRYFATDTDRRLRRGGVLTGSGEETP